MSTNAFQLNEEAKATFKAPVPVPAQEPIDEFDQFDEMFLHLNNALIEKHEALKEKAEELDRREAALKLNEEEIKQKEEELKKKEELKQKTASPEIPRILFLIPPKDQNNQSLPFAKLLGGTAFNSIYIQIGLLFKVIDTAMRMVYRSTYNKNTQLTIASVYYLTMFTSATLNDVYETSFFIYNSLYAIGDPDLRAALKPFYEKVVMKLKEAIP